MFTLRLRLVTVLTLIMSLGFMICWRQLCFAQDWLEDRSRAEGRGIRLGNFELHPGLGIEGGYDSNVYLQKNNPQDSFILRVTPHLMFSTLGDERQGEGARRQPPSVTFSGGVSASYYHYFATSQRDNVAGDASLRLVINPERPFSVAVTEDFVRNIRPFTRQGASRYARDQNNAGIEFSFGTKGGVFTGGVGYNFLVDILETNSFNYSNNFIHRISGKMAWRFLPATALLFDAQLDIVDYYNRAGTPVLLTDQRRLRSRVGINGAFTNKLSIQALVGVGAGYFDQGDDYENVVAQVEGRYTISPASHFAIGYSRDFAQSFLGNFYRQDEGYAKFDLLIARVFLVGARASVAYLNFGGVVDPDLLPLGEGGDSTREDVRVGASVFGEYRFTDWLGVNATFAYTGDFTDFKFRSGMTPMGLTVISVPGAYNKFEAWLGVRAFY